MQEIQQTQNAEAFVKLQDVKILGKIALRSNATFFKVIRGRERAGKS